MYKSCSRCGKIHNTNYTCNKGKVYNGGIERKLRNKHAWHIKADEIKRKSNNLCQVCRDQGRYTYNNLEVHHITKLIDDTDRLLDNYNLVCLCVEHHKMADKGDLDKEYLENLAKLRENNS